MGPLEKLFMGIERKRGTPAYDQDIDKLSMLFGDDSPRGAVGNASRALEVERGLPTPPQPRQMAQTALPPIPGEQMAEPCKHLRAIAPSDTFCSKHIPNIERRRSVPKKYRPRGI